MAVRCFLALGSNLGDRLANLQEAVDRLRAPDLRTLRSSRVYETAPVGPPQPEYLNAVLEVETDLPAPDVLRRCLVVEEAMGRVRAERWGPRVIDVDVLTFDEQTIEKPELVVPHPRMHERAFVLIPLAELTSDPPLPGNLRLRELRLPADALEGVRPFAPALRVRSREPAEP